MANTRQSQFSLSLLHCFSCCLVLTWAVSTSVSFAAVHSDPNYKASTSAGIICKPAKYYSDHMVLQREPQGAVLWGYSEPGYAVNVTFKGVNYTTKAELGSFGPDIGVWQVVLPPQPAGGPETINVTCTDPFNFYEGRFQIVDVVFGDIWICSGQSNMAFTVKQVFNATAELAASVNYPNIRVLAVAQIESTTPFYDVESLYRPWSRASPDALGAHAPEDFHYFSAVCWFFGRDLYDTYKVPVGLISSNWGGTPIEDWSAPNVVQACLNTTKAADNMYHSKSNFTKNKSDYIEDSFGGPHGESILWNSMIHPFLNMSIKGALWYQGEANTPDPKPYRCLFQGMIADWRYRWYHSSAKTTDPYFPFGFVQLATSGAPTIGTVGHYPLIRWHQTDDIGYVPSAGLQDVFMSVAVDLPDLESPYGAIHPRYKQDVSARLTLAARGVAYKEKGLTYLGPFPTKFTVDAASMTITVLYGNKGSGPIKIEGALTNTFEVCCSTFTTCQTFDLWTGAEVLQVVGSYSLQMSYNCLGQKPVAMRYLWRDYPCTFKKCTLYNKNGGLPAQPFLLPL